MGLLTRCSQGQQGLRISIAFEYSIINPLWWFEITEGLPNPIVKNGVIEVWDKPGIGVDFIVEAARKYLLEEDKNFFD